MKEVIYRKYRSKNFKEILGQSNVVDILRGSILLDATSHAYLFCGPRGTGKTSLARVMAKAINCLKFKEDGDVCNDCINCRMVNDSKTIDIIELDAASNRGIEEIRNLKEGINYLPVNLKKRVYILDEVHMLTKEAFNALLKTLEEPPSHVVFIMATTEPHKVPVTILSRVQRFDLTLVSREIIVEKLKLILNAERVGYEEGSLDIIYKISGGSFRDAESILNKVLSIEKTNISVDSVQKSLGLSSSSDIENFVVKILQNKPSIDILNDLNSLVKYNSNINYLIETMIIILKDILIDYFRLEQKKYKKENIIRLITALVELKEDVKDFSDKKLMFEIFFLKMISEESSDQEIVNHKEEKKEVVTEREVNIYNEGLGDLTSSSFVNDSSESILHRILSKIFILNPRIHSLLLKSELSLQSNSLTISVVNNFEEMQLKSKSVSELINEVLQDVAGSNFSFRITLKNYNQKETLDIKLQAQKNNQPDNVVENDQKNKDFDNSDIINSIF